MSDEVKLNTTTSFFLMSFAFLLSHSPKIPKIQRSYQEERVVYFHDSLVSYLKKTGELYYLNPIHIAEWENEYYIMDGQHRFMAYQRFYEESKTDFKVTVIYKKCATIEEFREYFIQLNNHFDTKDLVLEITEMDTSDRLKEYVNEKYKGHISHSARPKFPNINLDSFVKFLMERFKGSTSDVILEKMELMNEETKKYLFDKDIGNYTTIKNKGGLYVSYLIHKKDEPENKDGRKQLPKAVKKALWERKMGMDTLEGKCYVCSTKINYHEFHCGHKTAVKNGGSDNLTNLECVCALCNLSMGTEDLEIFKSKYF